MARKKKGAASSSSRCRCVTNKRTGRKVNLCPNPKSRTGWSFVKGGC